MKTVKPFYEDLIELWCACGFEDAKMKITVEKKPAFSGEVFYVEIQDKKTMSFRQRLVQAWRYICGSPKTEINCNSLLLDVDQVEEMVQILQKRLKFVKGYLAKIAKKL